MKNLFKRVDRKAKRKMMWKCDEELLSGENRDGDWKIFPAKIEDSWQKSEIFGENEKKSRSLLRKWIKTTWKSMWCPWKFNFPWKIQLVRVRYSRKRATFSRLFSTRSRDSPATFPLIFFDSLSQFWLHSHEFSLDRAALKIEGMREDEWKSLKPDTSKHVLFRRFERKIYCEKMWKIRSNSRFSGEISEISPVFPRFLAWWNGLEGCWVDRKNNLLISKNHMSAIATGGERTRERVNRNQQVGRRSLTTMEYRINSWFWSISLFSFSQRPWTFHFQLSEHFELTIYRT